jgi:hypothetical protein
VKSKSRELGRALETFESVVALNLLLDACRVNESRIRFAGILGIPNGPRVVGGARKSQTAAFPRPRVAPPWQMHSGSRQP